MVWVMVTQKLKETQSWSSLKQKKHINNEVYVKEKTGHVNAQHQQASYLTKKSHFSAFLHMHAPPV